MLTTTLESIHHLIRTRTLDEACAEFSGAETIINILGIVLKKVTREEGVIRPYIKADTGAQPSEVLLIFPVITNNQRFNS